MEIIAFGTRPGERPLLERAFADHHQVRCLAVPLDRDTAPLAAGYEVVSAARGDGLDAPVLQELAAGGTRMIARRAPGRGGVDLRAAADLGLTLSQAPAPAPDSAAEFAWALAGAVGRHLVPADPRTRAADRRDGGLLGRTFRGRTAGVAGTGGSGAAFARIAHGYGMELLGWDLVENPECTALGMRYVDRDTLFAGADLLSLHLPLTDGTRHLVGPGTLARMRPDAILVNTGPGALVDTAALAEHLGRGRLHGAGLDLHEDEEEQEDDTGDGAAPHRRGPAPDRGGREALARLAACPNVVLTAHQARCTEEAVAEAARATARNVEDYLAGRATEHTLVTPGPPPAAGR